MLYHKKYVLENTLDDLLQLKKKDKHDNSWLLSFAKVILLT